MQERFDRALFATVLVALALLISVSSAARFPGMLRQTRPMLGVSTSESFSESVAGNRYTSLR